MKMKFFFAILVLFCLGGTSIAQNEENRTDFFDKRKLFVGGNVNMGFGDNFTVLGGEPHIGYSLTNFLDLALNFNYTYMSQRDYSVVGDKLRSSIIAPGAFMRVFPVKFIFAQAQVEHSFMRNKYLPAIGSSYQRELLKSESNSILVGGGLASGREPQEGFFYFSILWDIGNNPRSPYVDNLNRSVPQFRGGVSIPLFR